MAEYFDIISLVFLIVTITVGFLKKMNIGLLAIGMSIVLAQLAGFSSSQVYAGFDAKLFTQLVGVTYLFGIAQVNGTIELLVKKTLALVGNKSFLVPIILFLTSGFFTAIGPGNISMGALMTVVAITIAVYMGKNPIFYALVTKAATNGFGLSPITPAGIISTNLGEAAGFSGFEMGVFLNVILWGVVCFITFALIFRKSDKATTAKVLKMEDLEAFTRPQIITIIGMVVMVSMVLFLGIDVGLASFFVAAILSFMGICKEKSALAKVPWGTLMLICGVGLLMNLVNQLGGVALLTEALLSIMTENTATPIIAGVSSLLSSVSSTSGVVLPTMYPTLTGIVQEFPSLSFTELASCVATGSFSSAFSPASTGGGLILAAYATATNSSENELNKIFGKLCVIAVGISILNVVLAWLGLYSIIG
ncbi:SLC13 family permease [Candidatus Epulonipiscium viviparus]|uniref:SLC13 family permease n=1 Tax=Candidatus Epulonipiscium viviparus TaxID=420336 RepID=UPI00273810EE|nr:SLC13 family permease [Candidatus Epulopiscium viviparus]